MNFWDILLLLFGLYVLGDGVYSLKKLAIYKRQWQEVTRRYEICKNTKSIVRTIRDEPFDDEKYYFLREIYLKDYPELANGMNKLLKFMPILARFAIITGIYCLVSPFLGLEKIPTAKIPVEVLALEPILILGFWMTIMLLIGDVHDTRRYSGDGGVRTPSTFKGRCKLILSYFLDADEFKQAKVRQLYREKYEYHLNRYVTVRSYLLCAFYSSSILAVTIKFLVRDVF